MANQFSPNLQLVLPTPGDPLSENTWGTLLNTDWDLVDAAVAGLLTLSVAGSSNVVLTSNQGSADQERNQSFKFTGVLTGNIYVLFPSGRTKMFTVNNATTGAFTLSIGVNNGSALPAGDTVTVAQGASAYLVSDGTNVLAIAPAGAAGGDLGGTYPNPTVTTTHLSAALPVDQGGTGAETLAAHGVLVGNGTSAVSVTSAGTSGQILTSNGASADPSFQDAPQGIPTGTGMDFWGDIAPDGYIFPYGQAISRTTYAALFAVFGTKYGAGDGSTTFNVPDRRGRASFGRDDMGGTAANRIQVSTTISTTSASNSATVASVSGLALGMTVTSANIPSGTTITAISGATITLSANATASASGTAARFSMFGDAQTLGASGGEQTHTQVIGEMVSHTHTYNPWNANQNISTTTGGFGINDLSNPNQVSGSTGGGLPFNVLPPGIVCNYIIKT